MANFSKFTRKRLGEILVNEGLVSTQQIQEALEAQGNTGEMLGETLVRLGYITEDRIAITLADQFQLPFINPSVYDIPKEMAQQIPVQYMLDHLFVPIDNFGKVVVVAIGGLLNDDVIQEIKQITSCEVFVYIATMGDVRKALEKLYPQLFQLGPTGASVRGIGYTQALGHTEGLEYDSPEAALDKMLPEDGEGDGDGKGKPKAAPARPARPGTGVRRPGTARKPGAPPRPAPAKPGNSGNSGNSKKKKPPPAGPVRPSGSSGEDEDDTWESLFDEADESVRKDLT